MIIKINDVSVYNNFVEKPIKTTVVVNNGVVSWIGDNYNGNVDKLIEGSDLAILPNFKYFDFEVISNYNLFDLNNLSQQSLEEQLQSFNNSKLSIMFLNNPTLLEGEYDIIIPFCKKHNIKIVAVAGRTLDEMGECDKLNGVTPIQYLEQFGVLDLEPIILSGANLEKDDIEKLAYYNATLCLDITNDWFLNNGLAQMPAIKKYNVNTVFNCNNIFKEIFLAYFLQKGYFKLIEDSLELDVLNYACFGFDKAFRNGCTVCEIGKTADFMVVKNFVDLKTFVLEGSPEQIVEKFVD